VKYDFDQVIDRRQTESAKWHHYGNDVLPMWVADMDFRSPQPVIDALNERVAQGIFGYPRHFSELIEVIVDRMATLFGWVVSPESIVFMPGVVTGFNLVCHAYGNAGDGVFMQTPVYFPFLSAPGYAGLERQEMELTYEVNGYYSIDFEAFESNLTDSTRVFLLSNPHNPVGRVFQKDEQEQMAEICLRHNIVICSDEIHGDLIFEGSRHIPMASLDPEIESQTVTLISPSKTFNLAGLKFSVAIVPNPTLRKTLTDARKGLVPSWPNLFGATAGLAAYRNGQEWLDQLLVYLQDNRDFLFEEVNIGLPDVRMGKPEGTYLAWLDCRSLDLPDDPQKFFLENAQVGMNNGADFGRGGEGFVRLNFACPKSTLVEALRRMERAISDL
jgi:cystathionine beta-lyase